MRINSNEDFHLFIENIITGGRRKWQRTSAKNNNNGGGLGFWGMVGAVLLALFIFSLVG